jgi:hypothetical protein
MPTPIRRQFIVALVLAGCSATSDPLPEPMPVPLQSRISRDPPRGTAARMDRHFTDSILIKNAVIAGELEDMRMPARRLRDDEGHHPTTWRPFIAANRAPRGRAPRHEDRRVAGAAAAGLARTCGDCHAAMGVGPRFDPPHDMPAAADDPRQRMQRHQWAADRMWEAIIDRSEYAWMAGVAALAVAPLDRADLTRDVELTEDVLRLNERVHELGALAGTSPSAGTRAPGCTANSSPPARGATRAAVDDPVR